jgi:hypothetical protein
MKQSFVRTLLVLALMGLIASAVFAQVPLKAVPYSTSIFAGNGSSPASCTGSTDAFGNGCLATEAQFMNPWAMVFDSQGNAYIADSSPSGSGSTTTIRKIDATTGIVTIFAGGLTAVSGTGTTPCDGVGGPDPAVVALSAIYSGTSGHGCPGPMSFLKQVRSMAIDANYLYLADSSASRMVKVGLSDSIITGQKYAHEVIPFAGASGSGWSGDGIDVKIKNPYAIALDGKGNVLFADNQGLYVRSVNLSTRQITTVVNCRGASNAVCSATVTPTAGCSATAAAAKDGKVNKVDGLGVDELGNLYIASSNCYSINKVAPNGLGVVDGTGAFSTVMGNGVGTGTNPDGSWYHFGTGNPVSNLRGLLVVDSNHLYWSTSNSVFYGDFSTGWARQFFGRSAGALGTDGVTLVCQVNTAPPYIGCPAPWVSQNNSSYFGGMAVDPNGNFYVVDSGQTSLSTGSQEIIKASIGTDFIGFGPKVTDTTARTQIVLANGTGIGGPASAIVPFAGALYEGSILPAKDCSTSSSGDLSTDCVVSVTYTPSTVGLETSALTLTGSGPTLPLQGLGNPVSTQSLAITASSGSMTFGGTVPTVTYTTDRDPISPALTTAPVCTTTATSASAPGTYPTTCSGATDARFDPITYVAGSITVNAAPVTVIADDNSMAYGGTVPALTFHTSPSVTLATPPTCTTTATSLSGAGTYPITCSGGADPDYSISYTPGTFTVSPMAAGLVVINKSAFTFPATAVGLGSGSQMVTLFNNSSTPVTVSSSISGDFTISGNGCTGVIAAGGTQCNIWVRFTPNTPGPKTGTLNINYSGAPAPLTVALDGNGGSQLTLSTTSMAFAGTVIGQGSASQMVNVYNQTASPVNVVALGITGNFIVSANSCTGVLASKSACNVWVRFTPTSVSNSLTGTLSLTADGNPAGTVALSGAGLAGPITINKVSMVFAPLAVGQGSGSQMVTLYNNSGAGITVTPSLVGADFIISGNGCTGTIAAGGTQCNLWVRFQPKSVGDPLTGTLTINSSAGLVGTVSLSGAGL